MRMPLFTRLSAIALILTPFVTYAAESVADLQRIAWQGLQEFKKIAASASSQ
jgi:hypothetical protein